MKGRTARSTPRYPYAWTASSRAAYVVPMARDQETLTQAFLALGENAADAKAMARAEIERGSPQLARIMFLKSAWRLIIDEDKKRDGEVAWIESWLRWGRSQKEPQSGVGAAIERLLASGADPDDLTDVVRAMQFELLFNLCDVLDEEGLDELRPLLPKGLDVGWRLYEVGPDGKPTRAIESLHESVGSYDPAGREGQPRSRVTKPAIWPR